MSDPPSSRAHDGGRPSPVKQALAVIARLERELSSARRKARAPVAIIGVGCRFPGKASDPASYWSLLRDGRDAITEIPRERVALDALFHPIPGTPGKCYTRHGGFIDDIDQFDPQLFAISPREAAAMDPQQRLALEVSWEALETAGLEPRTLQRARTGVFFGVAPSEYGQLARTLHDRGDREGIDSHHVTGTAPSAIAGRVAHFLKLQGPVMAIDTACSSALVAVHVAIQSLRAGECDVAIAGGVNVLVNPDSFVAGCQARMLSSRGRCRTFDAGADGYVRAEGCGVVILRRLADAQTEGDPVRGVIRGTAINHDGPSSGFTVPNGRAQVDLLRAALADADVRPDEVDYVEAHGTGTTLGDPIELGAIARVYASERSSARPLLVGSVKTNVGHLEAAAGIAGLIKALLALEHATIPRHLHFKEPNPHIAWDELAVTVPTANVPWTPGERPRRAGVSAFGLSGTNAHLILEEAPRDEVRPPRTAARSHLVAAISGPRDEVVNISAGRHARFLRARPEVDVSDVCHTLACGRVHHAHRLVIVARTREQLRADLESVAAGERPPSCVHGTRALAGGPPRIAFLFTGQGAQYPGMGRGLYECEPAFRAAIDRCDALARREFGVDLRGQLFDADEAAALETELAQPAIFALEYGLFRLWDTWGIRPDAVLGHSLGEYTAACVAGVLELEDALRLVLVRGRLMQSTRAGAMAVVDAPPDRVRAALDSLGALASVAAINGPSSVVISGEARIVHMICSRLAGDDIRSRRLPGTRAFHSPLMDPILDAFEIAAGKVQLSPPRLPMISCLTGAVASDEPASPRYWRRQLRGEVRFADGIQALDRLGCSIYVEVGPNPALLATASACAPLHDATLLPSLRRGREDAEVMYASLARLHVQGVQVDWRGFDRPFARRRIALPTYPFQRQRCWLPRTPPPPRWSLGGTPGAALHPLLGQRVPCPGRDIQYVSRVSFESHAYLVGQRLFGEPVATPALFLAVLIAAACDTVATSGVTLEDVLLLRPMVLSGPTHLHLQLSPGREGRIGFTLAGARSADVREASWLKHAIGKLRRIEVGHEPPVHNATLAELQGRCREEPSLTAFYEGFAAEGLEYGAHFRTLLRLWRNGSEAVALLDTPGLDEHEGVHPTIIDSCFQVLAAVLARRGQPGPYVPFSVERLYFYRTPTRSLWCHASLRAGGDDSTSTGDLWLCDDDGQLIVEITGLRIRKGTRKELFAGRARADADWQYVPVWRPRPLLRLSTADDEPRTWLVLRDRDPLGAALTRRLEERGSTCVIASPGYAFARDERDRFTIDPTRRDDFARLLAALAADGVKVDGVLFLWALDAALSEDGMHLERVQRRVYGSALHLTQTLLEARVSLSAGLFLVTRGAQSAGAPRPVAVGQAPLWGFGRVLLDEHPELHPRLVDLSPGDVHGEVEALAAELHADDGEDQIALRGEVRYGARLLRDQAPREPAAQSLDVPDTEAYRLEISEPGSLDTLGFRPTRRRPPGHGEVEIAVRAAGLSFRDVLSSLGMDRREPGVLGRECAGTVVAVGPDVSHLSLGDAVMGLARESLGPYVTADARHVVRTPASVELEDAAALPVAFLTAWYGLHHLGRMLPGDRVLIHAAAGGVGMAAVQLALRIGAEVYATASPGKWGTLRKLGVVNIYNSRTADYAREIAAATEGRGVDIVLNSLDGEFVPASMALLSPGGRFVELGEDRTWGARATSRFPGVAYRKVELRAVDPALIHQALTQLAEAFAIGELKPLPRRTFPITDAVAALRYMAQARHVGKVVLTLDHPHAEYERPPPIDPGGTYMITGGLGALGRQVARWLVDHGARHLVLAGRSEPTPEVQAELAALAAGGASLMIRQADVANRGQLVALLAEISRQAPPLRGIIHAAGVIEDATIPNQQWEQVRRVLAPKIDGAWHLHDLTQQTPLDFFVMFSSMASLIGPAGQANYAAANAFLDALAHHRRARGLPALSINWGPWAGAGMAGRVDDTRRRRQAERGLGTIDPERGVALLGRALARDRPQLGVLPVDWGALRSYWQKRRIPRLLEELMPDQAPRDSEARPGPDLLERLRALDPPARRDLLALALRAHAARILGLGAPGEIDDDRSLRDLGLDSLMAVELRNAISETVGCPLSSTFVFDHSSISAMLEHLLTRIVPGREGQVVSVTRERSSGVMTLSPTRVRIEPDRELPADHAGVLDRQTEVRSYMAWLSREHAIELFTAGEGPPLVLLPPLAATASIWQLQLDEFASSHRVIIPHYPGYGRSTMSRGSSTPEALAAQLGMILELLCPDQKIDLVGWSYGGMIAQRAALRSPDQLRTLALVSTTAGFAGWDGTRAARELLGKLRMERARTLDASPGSRANARIWALLRHVQGRVDAKVNLHYSDLATRFDAREQVSGIVTPTLIVQGHDDELTPPIHGLHLCRRIERARYHEFLSVGHFMPLHRHHSFNKCLRDFLRNPGRMTSGPTPSAVVRPRSRPESTRHD